MSNDEFDQAAKEISTKTGSGKKDSAATITMAPPAPSGPKPPAPSFAMPSIPVAIKLKALPTLVVVAKDKDSKFTEVGDKE